MATLTVLKCPESDGADRMIGRLEQLQKMEMIKIEDAATVSWAAGERKSRTRHLNNLAGLGALDGAFWGLLSGSSSSCPSWGWPSAPRWGG